MLVAILDGSLTINADVESTDGVIQFPAMMTNVSPDVRVATG